MEGKTNIPTHITLYFSIVKSIRDAMHYEHLGVGIEGDSLMNIGTTFGDCFVKFRF